MLKDITLGQYFPGNTVIHRLDPRTKLLGLICYIVALFLAKSYYSYALMALVLVTLSVLSRIRPKTLLSGLKTSTWKKPSARKPARKTGLPNIRMTIR